MRIDGRLASVLGLVVGCIFAPDSAIAGFVQVEGSVTVPATNSDSVISGTGCAAQIPSFCTTSLYGRSFQRDPVTGYPVLQPDNTAFGLGFAAVVLGSGQMKVLAATLGSGGISAFAQALVVNTLSFDTPAAGDFIMQAKISGTVTNNTNVGDLYSPYADTFVNWYRNDALAAADEFGIDFVGSGFNTVNMPLHLRAGHNDVSLVIKLQADAANGGKADFSKTLTLYGILPDGATFLGDDLGFFANRTDFIQSAIPEPETYAMLLAGLGLLGFSARRRLFTASS